MLEDLNESWSSTGCERRNEDEVLYHSFGGQALKERHRSMHLITGCDPEFRGLFLVIEGENRTRGEMGCTHVISKCSQQFPSRHSIVCLMMQSIGHAPLILLLQSQHVGLSLEWFPSSSNCINTDIIIDCYLKDGSFCVIAFLLMDFIFHGLKGSSHQSTFINCNGMSKCYRVHRGERISLQC